MIQPDARASTGSRTGSRSGGDPTPSVPLVPQGTGAQTVRSRDISVFLWLLFVALAVLMAMRIDAVDDRWFKGVVGVVFALVCALWVASDARERHYAKARGFVVACMIVPLLSAPVYVLSSRGAREFLKWVVRVAALIFTAVLVGALLSAMVHGVPAR